MYKKWNKTELKEYLRDLSDKYYNSDNPDEIINDEQYEVVKAEYESRYGKYKTIRASAKEDRKEIEFKYYLGSLDKMDTESQVKKFIKKWPNEEYVWSDKIDGAGVLLTYKNGKKSLYRLSKERSGIEISNILPYLNLPNLDITIDIRAEISIPKNILKKKYADTVGRSIASGALNKNPPDPIKMKQIKLYSHEILSGERLTAENQFKKLEKLGFNIPKNGILKKLNYDKLQELLEERRKNSEVEVDGLVITVNKQNELEDERNPKYSIAFKMLSEIAQTKVKFVEWNVSKHGKLYPRVKIKEVILGGSHFNWATGKSAEFIKSNKIGKGAIVEITRGKDIIPDILNVIEGTKADFPSKKDYEWDKTKKNIYTITDKYDEEIEKKKIENFAKTLNIKYLGIATIDKLYDKGLTSIIKILKVNKGKLIRLGVGEKSAERIIKNISIAMWNIKDINGKFTIDGLSKLMAGSVCFEAGFGKKKAKKLLEKYPTILDENWSETKIKKKLSQINGFGEETILIYINGIECFYKLLRKIKKIKFEMPELKKQGGLYPGSRTHLSTLLNGKTLVFSGFRDNEGILTKQIEQSGGRITGNVSGMTDILIVKNLEKLTGKVLDAKNRGVEVLTLNNFINKYF